MADVFKVTERASLAAPGSKNEEACAAAALPRQDGKTEESLNISDILYLSSCDFLKSIVLSEILGKPKSMRKARW